MIVARFVVVQVFLLVITYCLHKCIRLEFPSRSYLHTAKLFQDICIVSYYSDIIKNLYGGVKNLDTHITDVWWYERVTRLILPEEKKLICWKYVTLHTYLFHYVLVIPELNFPNCLAWLLMCYYFDPVFFPVTYQRLERKVSFCPGVFVSRSLL